MRMRMHCASLACSERHAVPTAVARIDALPSATCRVTPWWTCPGGQVGETLEEEEAKQFGQRTSLLRADPEAPRPTRKGARPAPRLLRGYGGEEDLPSLSRFVEQGLSASVEDGWMRAQLPTLTAKAKPKKPKAKTPPAATDNAERQAKRAKARAAAAAKEEALARERAEMLKQRSEASQRQRELDARQRMADEEAQASNIIEEIDGDEEGEGEGDGEEGEEGEDVEVEEMDEDDGSDVMDLDA